MEYNLCISDEEVNQIIEELQRINSNYTVELILKAIESCCQENQIVKEHETLIGCVKERIRMLKLM